MDDKEIQELDRLEGTHFWYRARKDWLEQWFTTRPKGLSVLDLGSATGGNTLSLIDLGFKVTSVEYSSVGVNIQREKGIPVIQGDARRLSFPDESFDIVICLDVIEHIFEDYDAAREIYRILKNGGEALISVPQDPKLWSNHDIAVNHVRRYTVQDLKALFLNANFETVQTWSSLILLRPLLIVKRKFAKGSDLGELNSVLNYILYKICRLEVILRIPKLQGVTLWAECKKHEMTTHSR